MCTIKQASQPSDARQHDTQHHGHGKNRIGRIAKFIHCTVVPTGSHPRSVPGMILPCSIASTAYFDFSNARSLQRHPPSKVLYRLRPRIARGGRMRRARPMHRGRLREPSGDAGRPPQKYLIPQMLLRHLLHRPHRWFRIQRTALCYRAYFLVTCIVLSLRPRAAKPA